MNIFDVFNDFKPCEALDAMDRIDEILSGMSNELAMSVLSTLLYNKAEATGMPVRRLITWFVESTLINAEQEGKI